MVRTTSLKVKIFGTGWVVVSIFGSKIRREPGSMLWNAHSVSNSTKKPIKTPFVLGAIIDLGACLNLVDADALKILTEAHSGLKAVFKEADREMPVNKGDNRMLDCAVIQYIHESNKREGQKQYDTVRCAFPEGNEVFQGSKISSRLHLQICVRNADCIKGFFLPRPVKDFNPNF